MILKKLILNNYKTYYGHQEINFYIPPEVRKDKKKNIILIGGLNGAGKTTILKAVNFALFGKRAMRDDEYRRIFSNVINNHFFDEGGRECYINLTVENDNNEEWELKVKWIFDHNKKVVNETREITIRRPGASIGRTQTVNDIATFNRFIDRKIPYHVAPFFIFDGEEIKDIILRQHSDEMKIAIQKLSGLETYKLLLEDLEDSKTYLEKKILNASGVDTRSADLSQELQKVTAQIEDLNIKIKNIAQRKADLEGQINDIKEVRKQKIQQNSNSRDSILKKLTACEVLLSQTQKELDTKFKEQAFLSLLSGPIESLKKRLLLEEKVNEQNSKRIASFTPYRDFLLELFNENKVEPNLTIAQQEQLLKNGQLLWDHRNSSDTKTDAVPVLHDLSKQQFNHLMNISIISKNSVLSIFQRISQLQSDKEQLEAELRNAPDSVDYEQESMQIDNLTKLLGEVELRMRNFRSKSNVLREEKAKYENLLSRSTKTDSNSEELKLQLEQVNSSIAFFKQYITEITQLKAEFIHSEFQRMLSELMRKQDEFGRVEFDIRTYSVRLYNDRNQEISIQDRSAGEMQIISSALVWALTKSSKYSLPMLIDTPLGRLDSYHRNHLINKYYKELSDQVIILSTDTEITQEYIKTVTDNSYKQYLLEYNDRLKYSIIKDGYFELKR